MREKIELKKEQKKQSLLDAAYRLFLEKGVAKTSVDEIVRGANVAKGTFYLYFHDKDQLLQQLTYQISARILGEAYEFVRQSHAEDFVEKVVMLIDCGGILPKEQAYPASDGTEFFLAHGEKAAESEGRPSLGQADDGAGKKHLCKEAYGGRAV